MKNLIFAACMVIAASFAAAAQVGTNKAAIEYDSLMNMRFYEETGGFLVEGLEVVFPPPGASPATFVITKPNGEVISSVPLRFEPLEKFPAFGVFRPAPGNPGNIRVAQSGDFVMAVRLGNETITTTSSSAATKTLFDACHTHPVILGEICQPLGLRVNMHVLRLARPNRHISRYSSENQIHSLPTPTTSSGKNPFYL